MKRYKPGFDGWGLLVFLLIMLPNFVWSSLPAPNDVLRRESVTPVLDAAASVCQVLFVGALCAVVSRERERPRLTPPVRGCIACGLLYYLGWGLYYAGIVHPAVILLLTVPPCLCFFFFALARKNYIAMLPLAGFTVCHLIYGIVNFMI